jgi:hypothetical protein
MVVEFDLMLAAANQLLPAKGATEVSAVPLTYQPKVCLAPHVLEISLEAGLGVSVRRATPRAGLQFTMPELGRMSRYGSPALE